jgi:hypothetical protein
MSVPKPASLAAEIITVAVCCIEFRISAERSITGRAQQVEAGMNSDWARTRFDKEARQQSARAPSAPHASLGR